MAKSQHVLEQLIYWTQNLPRFVSRKSAKTRVSTRPRLDSGGGYLPVFQSFWIQRVLSIWIAISLKLKPYVPKGFRVFTIQTGEKQREIYQLSFLDYLICKGLSDTIEKETAALLPSELYSFRKGMSNQLLCKNLATYIRSNRGMLLYAFKADISEYDQHIDHARVRKILSQAGFSPNFIQSVLNFIRAPIDKSRCLSRGLPTGTPIIPVLENLYLLEMDEMARKIQGGFYARYGDDLIFLHPDASVTHDISLRLLSLASSLALKIKPEKSIRFALITPGVSRPNPAAEFKPCFEFEHLGLRICSNGELGLPSRKTKKLRAHLKRELRTYFRTLKKTSLPPRDAARILAKAMKEHLSVGDPRAPGFAELVQRPMSEHDVQDWDLYLKQIVAKQVLGKISPKGLRTLGAKSFNKTGFSLSHRRNSRRKAKAA